MWVIYTINLPLAQNIKKSVIFRVGPGVTSLFVFHFWLTFYKRMKAKKPGPGQRSKAVCDPRVSIKTLLSKETGVRECAFLPVSGYIRVVRPVGEG